MPHPVYLKGFMKTEDYTGFVDKGGASWWAKGICNSPLYQAQGPAFTLSPTASSPLCLNYRHISALP